MNLDPLPIDSAIDDIRAALRHTRAVVVVAEPGAGKTTRVPPALLDAGKAIVLQPRRAAARAIARRIADEHGWRVGREVGWQIRFERRFQADTRLLIATEGVLTARLQHDPLLTGFSTIVLDEFHERSVHADLAIALARQAMLARDDLRLVVMSATMDAERVAAFLSCATIVVPGRTYPVHVSYEPHLKVSQAVAMSLERTTGTILCFQPGAREIERTLSELNDAQIDRRALVLPLHGTLSADRQDAALSGDGPVRRVVVCTNIAETSVTVLGVTAVVDTGLEKLARYDPALAIDSLRTERISQAAADQRAGRAGRTAPGVVVRLWNAADRLKPFREPELHRVDLSGVVLDIAGWGGDPRTLEWFEAPRPEAIGSAIALLNRMQALKGIAITGIGRAMLRLPLPPRLARIVVEADGHPDAVRVAALLAERHTFTWSNASTSSDLLSALDRWSDVPSPLRAYAEQLQQATDGQTRAAPPRLDESAFRRAILAGYPDRVAQRRGSNSPRFLLSTGTGAVLTGQSGVRDADFIVALDVQAPSSSADSESRIRLASAIEREWLEPTGKEVEHVVDERGVVRATETVRYDAIALRQRPVAVDAQRASELLASAWLARPRSDAERILLNRLRFAGVPLDLPQLLGAAAAGKRSVDEIVLDDALPYDVLRQLERDAPATLLLPSGRHARLDYSDGGTVGASVKLQELFGLAETPRIGSRREPLLLELRAPNGRAVQVTRDLRSFWDRTYPEVRKELRGRYPKHPWPEDPWSAVPTHRAKTRRGG